MKKCSTSLSVSSANQNDTEIPSHLSQNSPHQENKQQQILPRMRGKRKPYTLLLGMQTRAATMEISTETH
jgi:hypothetical protein